MGSKPDVERVWTVGSYPDIGRTFLSMAAALVDAAGVGPGDRVLDVACGTGNVAITADRRGAAVTGVDITPAMLEDARENATVAGADGVVWEEADAAALPFDDDAFDVTLSCVGHMFVDPPEAAARELLRVTASGGTVAFTSWTPDSVVPAMAKLMGEYVPPDPDSPPPPFLWGDPAVVEKRVGDGVSDLAFETGTVEQLALSPTHVWERVSTQSGLFILALETVEADAMADLRAEMVSTIADHFDDRTNALSMEYLLTRATVV